MDTIRYIMNWIKIINEIQNENIKMPPLLLLKPIRNSIFRCNKSRTFGRLCSAAKNIPPAAYVCRQTVFPSSHFLNAALISIYSTRHGLWLRSVSYRSDDRYDTSL